ncbi:type I restriction endonuclease subunit R [Ferrimonas senticii]|uniref:type I restriction endonuclease subunit R n=1 Tax=Ferrimonas senticii TaxID=394566 RepID=UPI0004866A7C|nr:HsdR family type I site-specific deoxyribonuclease [Ferrimonas senticii]
MSQDELNKVELPALAQLQSLGWRYVDGVALSPEHPSQERAALRDVVLVKRLEAAVQRLNPWISPENLRKVMRELTHPTHAALMEYNQALWNLLCGEGISVEQDLGKGRKGQTVTLIDFANPANNEFLCTSQFKVEGAQNIIPDILGFVNGLPLVVIECKSPYITNPVGDGIEQLRRYANLRGFAEEEGAQRLFWYNQLMITLCRDHAKVGTISSGPQHYGDWKDAYPFTDAELSQANVTQFVAQSADVVQRDGAGASLAHVAEASPQYGADFEALMAVTPQQRLIAGMLSPANFLDIIQNFVLFEPDEGRIIKKVARYQQFRAVNKVIERLKCGTDRQAKSGVVWHTQGSGKSLTMVMLAVKIRRDPELKSHKLVFITDRTQLDEQLTNTFMAAQGETVHNAGSVTDLKALLKKDSSDLVTAMVQKFLDLEKEQSQSEFVDLNPSDKIIVLADEAHRTQFGGLATTINKALPNAPKIGFTGTPLLKTQKMGQAFGGYIDAYKINEAVDDGATVRLLYQGREVKNQVAGESLDALFEEYFGEYSKEEQLEIKKKYGVEKAVREAPARIRWVCLDLLKHYREHIQPDGYKAMIVVGGRHAAVKFKETLDELGAPPSEVIISGDHNDPPYLAKYTDKAKQKQVISAFKKPLTENPVAFLIVKDMLLTGFDAPIAQVMYIDRKLQDHTLMQAIARVNRTCTSPVSKAAKPCGHVVDYYGLADYLTEALELFSSEDVEGTYESLKDEIPKLKATHTLAKGFFKDIKHPGDDGDYIDLCVLALKEESVRAQFEMAFKRFAKQMNIVLPDAAAAPFIGDMKVLGKIHNAARNRYRDPALDLTGVGEKVRKLVDEHIISTGVDPKIPPVDLLAANFKDELAQVKSDESKASEIESAIKHHITVNLEEDPEYYKSLSLRLRDIIEKTAGKWNEQYQLLLNLVASIESDRVQGAEESGLSQTEYAFYNILMAEVTNHSEMELMDEASAEAVKSTTQLLVQMLEEATEIIDFFSKADEVKRMKKEIKRAVLAQPFGCKELVIVLQERFMELAQTKFGKK